MVQWAERGSYREDNVLTFINYLKGQPVQFCPARRRIFYLGDYCARLDDGVRKALHNVITKKYYGFLPTCQNVLKNIVNGRIKNQIELMLEKLRQNPERIPSPSRDEMMKVFDALWTKV